MSDSKQNAKPIIGISIGDYNGVGPEVILKAVEANQLASICQVVIYGSIRVLNKYKNALQMKEWQLQGIQKIDQATPKHVCVVNCWNDQKTEIEPGKITQEAGKAAFAALARATEDLKAGALDALVTAPINKDNIQNDGFKFPGHTEYLADAFSVQDALMFMVADTVRVGVLTGHIPLSQVGENIKTENLSHKIRQILNSLRGDFGIRKPRVAVLGLNPHAGENGLLGNEEKEVIEPVIKTFRQQGELIYGAFPADGFFASGSYKKYDAVLAMYHDQGLVPFKTLAFNEGVNFTAGLPVVRTSPDHGTAYSIAGKNQASHDSMLQAIYLACDVWKYRNEAAALRKSSLASMTFSSEPQIPSPKHNKSK